MYIYSVSLHVKKDIEEDWVDWMKRKHIPEVIKTGYFENYKFYKVIVPSGIEDETNFIIDYKLESMDKYNQYMEKEAQRLQDDHKNRYHGKVRASRTVLEELNR